MMKLKKENFYTVSAMFQDKIVKRHIKQTDDLKFRVLHGCEQEVTSERENIAWSDV